jgi:hypothetical protein
MVRPAYPSQNSCCRLEFPAKSLGGPVTLRVDSERWCESVIDPPASLDQFACCGDVATSVCEACGQALCETHEVLCPICYGVTCSTCDHVCRLTPQDHRKAA